MFVTVCTVENGKATDLTHFDGSGSAFHLSHIHNDYKTRFKFV